MSNNECTVVVFTENGGRILHGEDKRNWEMRTDCLINPIFPRGIPPHLWTMKDGKIVALAQPAIKHKRRFSRKLMWFSFGFVAGCVVCSLILFLRGFHG